MKKILIVCFFLGLVLFFVQGVKAGHVGCGTTLTTDTILDSDLVCPETGLIIGADGITLDCGGHSITHSIKDTDTFYHGISFFNEFGATVKNCYVRNFGVGIAVSNGKIIVNNTISDNIIGIVIRGSHDSILTSNFIINFYY